MIKKEILAEQLFDSINSIDKSLNVFKYSLDKAKKIGIKNEYTMEGLEIILHINMRTNQKR